MNRHKRYPPEVRERAVRLVPEHQEDYSRGGSIIIYEISLVFCIDD